MGVCKPATPLLAAALSLGGCDLFKAETGHRSMTVTHHRLQPAEVTVPAEQPFVLTVGTIKEVDIAISAADAGINDLRIPATAADYGSPVVTHVHPSRTARIPLGPLKAGRYTVSCECDGQPSTAVIVAR
ncbi:cupredoxin domain-containing protein [Rhodopila globiformis]|uniref:EfeO-type cupredoxin-like domain-containing protein n=1 Tax=Rhodopila globiformis TaxID=1071 RepID=A0A2S6NJZ3_RHOGL|nr:cupredoxin domain-containing protein [Rhodopila globiformis]PPQ35266.1 hypothetical protein CCS01_07910 [Rhodopila globiformis]